MTQLSYSFCMSMLHSLWQAGMLLLVFLLSENIFKNKISPLQKRNLLFILLLAQAVFFLVTFFIYFLDIENTATINFIGKTVTDILSADIIYTTTPWLFTFYLIGITYKMIKALYEWVNFKKQYQLGLQRPTIDLKLFTALKANHFGIKRKVQLWFSNSINTPITFGFLKPIIVLPVALINQISIRQAETLILHELTHIKANDYLLNWALVIVENIFFFNPCIAALCKRVRLEREKYCDSNVIAFEYSPLLYAETLLQAQNFRKFIPQYQLAAVTGKKQLLQRIQFFTNKNNSVTQKRNKFVFSLFSILLLFIFSAAVLFQYKIAATPKHVAETAYTAFSEMPNEINTPAFVNNILEDFTDEKLKSIEAAVQQQQPIIEKQLKKLEPLIKSIQKEAEVFAQKFDENYVMPAALKQNDATRQIVIKEEQSGSKNATVKVYTVSFINGQWVLIPEWMLAAKEVNTDSLHTTIDSSLVKQEESD